MDILTAAQRGALRQLIDPAHMPGSAYATISVAELAAALDTIDALEEALRAADARVTAAEMRLAALAPLRRSAEALASVDRAVGGAPCASLDAAIGAVCVEVVALRRLDQPPTAPPSGGAWLLNEASVIIEYEGEEAGDLRRLDLVEAGRVLIIGLAEPDSALPVGLTTLVPVDGHCRVCGCSQFNACETKTGPCRWAEPDLCSACAGRAS